MTDKKHRYSLSKIRRMIAMLPMLRQGEFPKESKETGYTDNPIRTKRFKPDAYFVSTVIQAATLDKAIEKAGLYGVLLEYACIFPEDYSLLVQHTANCMKVRYQTVERNMNKALRKIQEELDR